MKKWYRIELILLVLLILSACSSEEVPTPEPFPNENYVYNPDSVSDIAKAFVNLQPDIEMCREVHAATQKAISLGLDESYYFVEMFGKGEKITKTSEIQRQILSKLESLSDTNNIKQLFASVSSDSHYLRHYQIYWPYSQSWDGNTLPAITFKIKESPSIRQDSNIGYRFINGNVEEVRVDDGYAQMYPVWIINYNPIPYEEYPDFAIQDWIEKTYPAYSSTTGTGITKYIIYAKDKNLKDNPTYIQPPYFDEVRDSLLYYEEGIKVYEEETDTISLYFRHVLFQQKSRQLHSLFVGGAHYIYNFETVDKADININDYEFDELENAYDNIQTEHVGIRFVFLRSEMIGGKRKNFDKLISWRWLPHEDVMPFSYLQEFGGNEFEYIEDRVQHKHLVTLLHVEGKRFRISKNTFSGNFIFRKDDLLISYDNHSRYAPTKYRNTHWIDRRSYYLEFGKGVICQLAATKGVSTPVWYTPTSNE